MRSGYAVMTRVVLQPLQIAWVRGYGEVDDAASIFTLACIHSHKNALLIKPGLLFCSRSLNAAFAFLIVFVGLHIHVSTIYSDR